MILYIMKYEMGKNLIRIKKLARIIAVKDLKGHGKNENQSNIIDYKTAVKIYAPTIKHPLNPFVGPYVIRMLIANERKNSVWCSENGSKRD